MAEVDAHRVVGDVQELLYPHRATHTLGVGGTQRGVVQRRAVPMRVRLRGSKQGDRPVARDALRVSKVELHAHASDVTGEVVHCELKEVARPACQKKGAISSASYPG